MLFRWHLGGGFILALLCDLFDCVTDRRPNLGNLVLNILGRALQPSSKVVYGETFTRLCGATLSRDSSLYKR